MESNKLTKLYESMYQPTFKSDEDVIGKTLKLDGRRFRVIKRDHELGTQFWNSSSEPEIVAGDLDEPNAVVRVDTRLLWLIDSDEISGEFEVEQP